jgi:hypothetical protein
VIWSVSHRADPFARDIADRHYNRQKPGACQFAPPGRCLVLTAKSAFGKALWITSWPFGKYVKHRWPGAWVCSAFRNEHLGIPAHQMILDALAATVAYYGVPPLLGMVTFIDPKRVQPIRRRGKDHWGYTWELAGFVRDGLTQGGLMAFRLPPSAFPTADPAHGFTVEHRDFRQPKDLAHEQWLTAA